MAAAIHYPTGVPNLVSASGTHQRGKPATIADWKQVNATFRLRLGFMASPWRGSGCFHNTILDYESTGWLIVSRNGNGSGEGARQSGRIIHKSPPGDKNGALSRWRRPTVGQPLLILGRSTFARPFALDTGELPQQ